MRPCGHPGCQDRSGYVLHTVGFPGQDLLIGCRTHVLRALAAAPHLRAAPWPRNPGNGKPDLSVTAPIDPNAPFTKPTPLTDEEMAACTTANGEYGPVFFGGGGKP